MQTLHGLNAAIIPQREFALRRWYYADPLWYYHGPAAGELFSTPTAIELIDPELRNLCQLLHDAGLRTTPSCQGHFYPRQHFERVWCELNREARAIRHEGLVVRDSEMDRPYIFQDPAYTVPWCDFESFLDAAGAEQHKGYLGVLVPAEQDDIRAVLIASPYAGPCGWMVQDSDLTRQLRITTFSIFVNPVSPRSRKAEWSAVTRYFERICHHAAAR